MRKCFRCLLEKPLDEYYPKRRKLAKDGYANICKFCAKRGASEWSAINAARHSENTYKWKRENKGKHAASVAKWAKKNPGKRNEGYAARRATKKNATPAWRNAFFMEEIYDLATRRTKATGFKWEVDHIVPLQSQAVCGLHVEFNLQVIPAVANRSKHNRRWQYMPDLTAAFR